MVRGDVFTLPSSKGGAFSPASGSKIEDERERLVDRLHDEHAPVSLGKLSAHDRGRRTSC
jgi:hypothetical protein